MLSEIAQVVIAIKGIGSSLTTLASGAHQPLNRAAIYDRHTGRVTSKFSSRDLAGITSAEFKVILSSIRAERPSWGDRCAGHFNEGWEDFLAGEGFLACPVGRSSVLRYLVGTDLGLVLQGGPDSCKVVDSGRKFPKPLHSVILPSCRSRQTPSRLKFPALFAELVLLRLSYKKHLCRLKLRKKPKGSSEALEPCNIFFLGDFSDRQEAALCMTRTSAPCGPPCGPFL